MTTSNSQSLYLDEVMSQGLKGLPAAESHIYMADLLSHNMLFAQPRLCTSLHPTCVRPLAVYNQATSLKAHLSSVSQCDLTSNGKVIRRKLFVRNWSESDILRARSLVHIIRHAQCALNVPMISTQPDIIKTAYERVCLCCQRWFLTLIPN